MRSGVTVSVVNFDPGSADEEIILIFHMYCAPAGAFQEDASTFNFKHRERETRRACTRLDTIRDRRDWHLQSESLESPQAQPLAAVTPSSRTSRGHKGPFRRLCVCLFRKEAELLAKQFVPDYP